MLDLSCMLATYTLAIHLFPLICAFLWKCNKKDVYALKCWILSNFQMKRNENLVKSKEAMPISAKYSEIIRYFFLIR